MGWKESVALAISSAVLVACAHVEAVSVKGSYLALPTEAWVETCKLRNSTFSLWFSANRAWCLKLGKAPDRIDRQWVLPAGMRLRIRQKLHMAGVDADWVLYRLEPPSILPPTPGGLFVSADRLRFNLPNISPKRPSVTDDR